MALFKVKPKTLAEILSPLSQIVDDLRTHVELHSSRANDANENIALWEAEKKDANAQVISASALIAKYKVLLPVETSVAQQTK